MTRGAASRARGCGAGSVRAAGTAGLWDGISQGCRDSAAVGTAASGWACPVGPVSPTRRTQALGSWGCLPALSLPALSCGTSGAWQSRALAPAAQALPSGCGSQHGAPAPAMNTAPTLCPGRPMGTCWVSCSPCAQGRWGTWEKDVA